ncbi:MAG TPA: GPP34 family phosphoprotein [Micromonosporaceae bacterium]|nr:GPP34 family phosphoprotein [Micromonosporaceae bacterium]
MSVQPVERTAAYRLRTILGTGSYPIAQPPLRAELFLIAHDDETGQSHIVPTRLELGLAAAILLELWLDGKIQIGWRFIARQGIYEADPGLITVRDAAPTGDSLKDAALAMLWHTAGPRVSDFIRAFAATNLYDRVRGDMIATRVLHRITRRRFFRRVDSYPAAYQDHPVRARTRVRDLATSDLVTGRHTSRRNVTPPDPNDVALTALLVAVGLRRHLHSSDETLQYGLDAVTRLNPTIRDIAAAVSQIR